jgi:membrane protein
MGRRTRDPARDTRVTDDNGSAARRGRFAREGDASRARPDDERGDDGRDDRGAPDSPAELDGKARKGVLKRTVAEFREDNLIDWAAALTYYGVLALFPGLMVLVSLLGLIGTSATQPLLDNLGTVAPGPAKDIATNAIENLQANQGAAGVAAIIGIALALWSASGYVGAFTRASNSIYEIGEGRPIWKLKPIQLGITLVMVLVVAVMALAIVLTGPIARTAGDIIGLGDTAVTVWSIAKWPVLALMFMVMLAFLYYSAPNVKHPKFQWVSPGSVLAIVLWVIVSALFALYVANFPNDKTYGTFGGVIFFLTWLWISNIVILLGAELNAETERGRQIEGGLRPVDTEPFLEPRDTRKLDD